MKAAAVVFAAALAQLAACMPPERDTDSSSESDATGECEFTIGTPYRDAEKCGVFHQCVHGVIRTKTCPRGLHFDEVQGVCEYPKLVGCSYASKDLKDDYIEPDRPYARYAKPDFTTNNKYHPDKYVKKPRPPAPQHPKKRKRSDALPLPKKPAIPPFDFERFFRTDPAAEFADKVPAFLRHARPYDKRRKESQKSEPHSEDTGMYGIFPKPPKSLGYDEYPTTPVVESYPQRAPQPKKKATAQYVDYEPQKEYPRAPKQPKTKYSKYPKSDFRAHRDHKFVQPPTDYRNQLAKYDQRDQYAYHQEDKTTPRPVYGLPKTAFNSQQQPDSQLLIRYKKPQQKAQAYPTRSQQQQPPSSDQTYYGDYEGVEYPPTTSSERAVPDERYHYTPKKPAHGPRFRPESLKTVDSYERPRRQQPHNNDFEANRPGKPTSKPYRHFQPQHDDVTQLTYQELLETTPRYIDDYTSKHYSNTPTTSQKPPETTLPYTIKEQLPEGAPFTYSKKRPSKPGVEQQQSYYDAEEVSEPHDYHAYELERPVTYPKQYPSTKDVSPHYESSGRPVDYGQHGQHHTRDEHNYQTSTRTVPSDYHYEEEPFYPTPNPYSTSTAAGNKQKEGQKYIRYELPQIEPKKVKKHTAGYSNKHYNAKPPQLNIQDYYHQDTRHINNVPKTKVRQQQSDRYVPQSQPPVVYENDYGEHYQPGPRPKSQARPQYDTRQTQYPYQNHYQKSPYQEEKAYASEPKVIYLTFDDGPNAGTPGVLDTLQRHGVKGTFFINSVNLGQSWTNSDGNLVRAVQDGHMIADHSIDHMNHNGGGNRNSYVDVEVDASYFGKANSDPVVKVLGRSKLPGDSIRYVIHTMSNYIRMPYTNNWRVTTADGKKIVHDCPGCTLPAASSGKKGMELADYLHDQHGIQVVGWDIEWHVNYGAGTLNEGADAILRQIRDVRPKDRNKVVILTHDIGLKSKRSQETLGEFIEKAKRLGYVFRTLDTYIRD